MNSNNQTLYALEEVIHLRPKDAVGYINRGNSYWRQSDYEKAIADYGKAIELDPENTESTWLGQKTCYIIGDFDKAIADYDEAIRLDPKHVNAYHWRGLRLRCKRGV